MYVCHFYWSCCKIWSAKSLLTWYLSFAMCIWTFIFVVMICTSSIYRGTISLSLSSSLARMMMPWKKQDRVHLFAFVFVFCEDDDGMRRQDRGPLISLCICLCLFLCLLQRWWWEEKTRRGAISERAPAYTRTLTLIYNAARHGDKNT